jgi:hypothetical protein
MTEVVEGLPSKQEVFVGEKEMNNEWAMSFIYGHNSFKDYSKGLRKLSAKFTTICFEW